MRNIDNPSYGCWEAMKQRCYNPNVKQFKDYGGRGITVCDRWRDSFVNFLDDMGERPEGYSIDRIDNNGNYELENCRFITIAENTRRAHLGKVVSKETGRKISEAKMGTKYSPHSEMTKLKISLAHKGKKLSEEHKAKLRKPKSEEAKRNMVKAWVKRRLAKEQVI